jgi:HAMP domain-containing protein
MRILRTFGNRYLALLLVAALAACLSGCVSAPQSKLQRVALAYQTGKITSDALTQMIHAGKFNEAEKAEINAAAVTVKETVGLMEMAALNDDNVQYRSALARFNAVMDKLIATRIEAERKSNAER